MSTREEVFGREAVIDGIVPRCLERPKRGPNRDLPVVLLLGHRGSGKTTLLEALRRQPDQVPRAHLDFGGGGMEPRRTVIELAFQLSRRRPDVGRLKFPRLMLCLLVVGSEFDEHDRRQAITDFRDSVRNDSRLGQFRAGIVPRLEPLQTAGLLPQWAGAAADLALLGVREVAWRTRLLGIQEGLRALRDADPALSSTDILVDLNRLDRGDDAERARVDETLLEAFLTDLYAGFNQGWTANDRKYNCLALLDNADAPDGRAFLRMLVRVRHSRVAPPDARPCDPLLVVATSRGWAVPAVDDSGGGRVRVLDEIGYDDWDKHRDQGHRGQDAWWYPVALRDLTLDEVRSMVRSEGLEYLTALPPFLHRLTHGHPRTVRGVLDATLRAAGQEPTLGRFARPDVLELPHPEVRAGTERRPPVAEWVLEDWLEGVEREVREAMVTCTAAAGTSAAVLRNALEERVTTDMPDKLLHAAGRNRWVVNDDLGYHWDILRPLLLECGAGEPERRQVMHPLLRRLLLRQLAARDERHPDCWVAVHARLRDHYEQRDATQVAYHRLALGDVQSVVQYFRSRFPTGVKPGPDAVDAASWLAELTMVTRAPKRHTPDEALSPYERAEALARDAGCHPDPGAPLETYLTRLVTFMWVAADPLWDPTGTLTPWISDQLKFLSQFTDQDRAYNILTKATELYHSRQQH